MNPKNKSMFHSKLLSNLLILVLFATACAAQKSPPESGSTVATEQQGADDKRKTPSEEPAQSVVKSLTWTRTGVGNIKFVIEQDAKGSGFTAKVLKYDFKDRDESFAIESEPLIEGLKAIFSGKVKIEERATDPSALTETRTEVTLLDSSGNSETLKSPMIQDEKNAKTLEDLENAVREYMKILDGRCIMIAPKECSDLTDLSGTWVKQNESSKLSVTDEITLLETVSDHKKKYTMKQTITDSPKSISKILNYTLEYDSSTCILVQQSVESKTSVRGKVLEVSQDGKEIKSGICEDEQCLNVKETVTAKKSS